MPRLGSNHTNGLAAPTGHARPRSWRSAARPAGRFITRRGRSFRWLGFAVPLGACLAIAACGSHAARTTAAAAARQTPLVPSLPATSVTAPRAPARDHRATNHHARSTSRARTSPARSGTTSSAGSKAPRLLGRSGSLLNVGPHAPAAERQTTHASRTLLGLPTSTSASGNGGQPTGSQPTSLLP